MNTLFKYLFCWGFSLLLISSCGEDIDPNWPGSNYQQNLKIKPLTANNNIVAHRGGASEADLPDNSIASLEYAIGLRCYATECDIYITADKKIIVAHADGKGQINGLYPFEATYKEISNKGTLDNGEKIPLLEDYLSAAVKRGSCTKVWLDIKKVTAPVFNPAHSISACEEACRIITDRGIQDWVEFICTGEEQVIDACIPICRDAGINIAWMAGGNPDKYVAKGITWANISTDNINDLTSTASYGISEYLEKGISISVFNIDKTDNYDKLNKKFGNKIKAICTNNPKKILEHMDKI